MIFAIMLVKDEEDIIETTIKNTLSQVDQLLIIENNCNNNIKNIIKSFNNITSFNKNEPYHHSAWMTELAQYAFKKKAKWVIPIDADEIWENIQSINNVQDNIDLIKIHELHNYIPNKFNDINKMKLYELEDISSYSRIIFRPHQNTLITEGSHHTNNLKGMFVSNDIKIKHYPIRSRDQYYNKIKNGVEALVARGEQQNIAFHWRRWYSYIQDGTFDIHFRKFYLPLI